MMENVVRDRCYFMRSLRLAASADTRPIWDC